MMVIGSTHTSGRTLPCWPMRQVGTKTVGTITDQHLSLLAWGREPAGQEPVAVGDRGPSAYVS